MLGSPAAGEPPPWATSAARRNGSVARGATTKLVRSPFLHAIDVELEPAARDQGLARLRHEQLVLQRFAKGRGQLDAPAIDRHPVDLERPRAVLPCHIAGGVLAQDALGREALGPASPALSTGLARLVVAHHHQRPSALGAGVHGPRRARAVELVALGEERLQIGLDQRARVTGLPLIVRDIAAPNQCEEIRSTAAERMRGLSSSPW